MSRKHKLPKVLSRADAIRVVTFPNTRSFTGLRNRVALQLMYRCGLRVSEVCNLLHQDVHLDEGYLFIVGKGSKERMVPLDPDTAAICQKWNERRLEGVRWFLHTTKGTQVSDRYFRALLARISRETGIYVSDGRRKKPVHPHVLRHCFCTERLEDGFSIIEVQHMAGHSSVATTQIYTHVRPEHLRLKMQGLGPLSVPV